MKYDVYTYPVLGIENHFLTGDFAVVLKNIKIEEGNYIFEFESELNEPTIEAHVNAGNASISIRVRNRAFYSKLFEFESKKLTITIPLSDIGEHFAFEFKSFVLLKKPISAYVNTNADKIRSGYAFNLIKGNLLAVGETIKVEFNEKYELFGGAGSFLKLKIDSEDDDVLPYLNIDKHVIYIMLNRTDFNLITSVNNSSYKEILLGNLVFPIVIDLLWQIKSEEIEVNENDWGQPLMELIGVSEISELDPFNAAQELLSNPVSLSSKKLNELISEEDES
jgi:hypothetical protein